MNDSAKQRGAPVAVPAGFGEARMMATRDDLPPEWEPAPAIGGGNPDGTFSQEDLLHQTLSEAGGESAEGFVSIWRWPSD